MPEKVSSLRAHHLFTLLTARGFPSVEDYARSELEGVSRRHDKDDLIGPDGVYSNLFMQKICLAVATYEGLPDNQGVIINSEPDLFCSACYKGEHCRIRGSADGSWLGDFADFVRALPKGQSKRTSIKGRGDEMTITTDAATMHAFLDSKTKK